MTTEYTPDDALNDFLLIEAVLGEKERPAGGRVDLACKRVEGRLMSLKASETVPAERWCGGCFNYCFKNDECLSAEAPDKGEAKRSSGECPWFWPMVNGTGGGCDE